MKPSIDDMNRIRIDHVLWTILGRRLDEFKGNDATVHNLLLFGRMHGRVRKKRLKEGSKPNRMSTSNNVLFFYGRRKDKVAKRKHSLQTVGIQRLVARVKTHIHLVEEEFLKIAGVRRLVYPRSMNGSIGGCDR